jgi:hypothetical protein
MMNGGAGQAGIIQSSTLAQACGVTPVGVVPQVHILQSQSASGHADQQCAMTRRAPRCTLEAPLA